MAVHKAFSQPTQSWRSRRPTLAFSLESANDPWEQCELLLVESLYEGVLSVSNSTTLAHILPPPNARWASAKHYRGLIDARPACDENDFHDDHPLVSYSMTPSYLWFEYDFVLTLTYLGSCK